MLFADVYYYKMCFFNLILITFYLKSIIYGKEISKVCYKYAYIFLFSRLLQSLSCIIWFIKLFQLYFIANKVILIEVYDFNMLKISLMKFKHFFSIFKNVWNLSLKYIHIP